MSFVLVEDEALNILLIYGTFSPRSVILRHHPFLFHVKMLWNIAFKEVTWSDQHTSNCLHTLNTNHKIKAGFVLQLSLGNCFSFKMYLNCEEENECVFSAVPLWTSTGICQSVLWAPVYIPCLYLSREIYYVYPLQGHGLLQFLNKSL